MFLSCRRFLTAISLAATVAAVGAQPAMADPAPALRAPDNVVATTNGDGNVSVLWTNTGASSYSVYYFSAIGGGYTNRQVFPQSRSNDVGTYFTSLNDEWTTMCVYAIGSATKSATVCSQAFLPHYPHPVHPVYAPSVSMADVTEAEGAGLHTTHVAVNLSYADTHDITFKWATESRTAQGGGDFVSDNGEIVIPAGSTQVLIPVRIKGDRSAELSESFRVNITALDNAPVVDRTAVVTLQNDD